MIQIKHKKSLLITLGISSVMMAVGLLFTNAHNVPLDDLGCHKDPPNSKYHCHTGALKGREFASREEAQRAVASVNTTGEEPETEFAVRVEDSPQAKAAKAQDKEDLSAALPPPPQQQTAVVNASLLKVITWNIKKKAEKLDYDRIVNVMSEADVAVLQGLDLDEKGKGPLHITGDLMQQRIGEKVCRAWFRNSSGGKEHYGILWRSSTVGYVDKGGEIKDSCGEMAVIIPMTSKIASSLFFSKVQKKMFMLGTINVDGKAGKPDVAGLFKSLESSNFPTIVTGDVRSSADIKKWAFKPALSGTISSKKGRGSRVPTENVWTRNAVVARAVHINLYDRFSEISTKEIDTVLSESFPTLAEVALVPEADDQLTTMIMKSKKDTVSPPKKDASKPPKAVTEARAKDSFEEPREDLEEEMIDADGGERRGPAAKSAKKKKKKKH